MCCVSFLDVIQPSLATITPEIIPDNENMAMYGDHEQNASK